MHYMAYVRFKLSTPKRLVYRLDSYNSITDHWASIQREESVRGFIIILFQLSHSSQTMALLASRYDLYLYLD